MIVPQEAGPHQQVHAQEENKTRLYLDENPGSLASNPRAAQAKHAEEHNKFAVGYGLFRANSGHCKLSSPARQSP
jgi:hypothetical protein